MATREPHWLVSPSSSISPSFTPRSNGVLSRGHTNPQGECFLCSLQPPETHPSPPPPQPPRSSRVPPPKPVGRYVGVLEEEGLFEKRSTAAPKRKPGRPRKVVPAQPQAEAPTAPKEAPPQAPWEIPPGMASLARSISPGEVVLVAAYVVRSPFGSRLGDIAEVSWKILPSFFGFSVSGHENKYPNISAVISWIHGEKSALGLGWVTNGGGGVFPLTELGKTLAEKLLKAASRIVA